MCALAALLDLRAWRHLRSANRESIDEPIPAPSDG